MAGARRSGPLVIRRRVASPGAGRAEVAAVVASGAVEVDCSSLHQAQLL